MFWALRLLEAIWFAVLRVELGWLKAVGLPSIALSLVAWLSLDLEVDLAYVWEAAALANYETPPVIGALLAELYEF